MTDSLYFRLGGQNAVDSAVDIFYRKVLADNRVNYFFEDVDMEKQINKQKGFLTMVLGGPNHYTGKNMREGHKYLLDKGLDNSHVDVILELLGQTLTELGVSVKDIQEVTSVANSVRNDVLNC